MVKTTVNFQEYSEAKKAMIESIRDLLSLKLVLPLGNPNLKLLHTNQFLFTELPEEVFELANLDAIGKVMNSEYSRYSGYQLNRWYIEATTITNDKSDFSIELELNPFASPTYDYKKSYVEYLKAYSDAANSNTTSNTNSTTNNTNSSTNNVASTQNTLKLKKVKGFNKSDQEYIIKVTTEALKKRNNPTNQKPIAFAVYEHYNKNHVYSGYDCMRKMRKYGFEGCWKQKGHNCGDGASTLVAMFRCAGLTADIMHKYGHFYVRVKIDGNWWYCDQAGEEGHNNWRTLGKKGDNNNVYHGITSSASVVGFKYC